MRSCPWTGARAISFQAKAVVAALAILLGPLLLGPGQAAATTIPKVFEEVAVFHGIEDATIFYAIALQESGRRNPGSGHFEPWPWTLNVEGQGYYYDSLGAVWDALSGFVDDGRKSIDIGMTQVNYPANDHLVVDIYGALDPRTNLRLGAEILAECYGRLRDWWKSVGCYHSPNPARAARYAAAVRKRWLALQHEETR